MSSAKRYRRSCENFSGCGQCLTACRDGAYDAIRKRKTSIEVERELCDGCGLCLQVCPEEAIRLNLVRA
ncbi:MAG: 4Fe-4S binding protein [Deltaproteobacteria bacterium]|nr:4Fe-4S binding protein [Deltaproteobacteria bacterium]